ncbi:MAG: two-component system response regulator [Deltaproteobacteria bacterium]|nr:two-component system response regulator [Deltaproteobacteria bacterium]
MPIASQLAIFLAPQPGWDIAMGASVQNHTVLFVDDEVNILKALQRLLRNEPIDVLTANCPNEALELIERAGPQVVVSDQRMPEMAGVDFLACVRDRHSEVVRMMLTGFTDMTVAVEAINKGEIYRLITKPWNDEELKATLRQAFDHYDLKAEVKRLNSVTREQNFKLHDMNKNLEEKVRERTKQLDGKNTELRTAYIQTIRALAEAIDAKDAYTRGHSERVAVYASRIARELSLRRELIERVYFAGLLHDVGKIGIPDAIITKPDHLNEIEYEEIKLHPEIGAKILEPVEFLRSVVPCVRHHHEWYDGCKGGYPDRLVGDQIPLPSRVIVVADTVEAMTSDRPYRKALPVETVVEELHRFSGTQFDPVVVDAFLKLLEDEGESFISKNQKFDIYAFIEG